MDTTDEEGGERAIYAAVDMFACPCAVMCARDCNQTRHAAEGDGSCTWHSALEERREEGWSAGSVRSLIRTSAPDGQDCVSHSYISYIYIRKPYRQLYDK